MSQNTPLPFKSSNPQVAKLLKKLDKQAKDQGLDSGLLLMAKQDPAMADIMARMIDSARQSSTAA